MPNYYEISPTHDTLVLREGKGSASFAVRYVGGHSVEARAIAVPMDGAEEGWLKVDPPDQREMAPGQTQTFKVTVTIPPGTAPSRYGFRLDVVSVRNPDEEYDRGPLVAFQVNVSEEPEPEKGFPWWAVILAAVLLILIIGGIIWWANSGSGRGSASIGEAVIEEGVIEEDVARPVEPGLVARPEVMVESRALQPGRCKDGTTVTSNASLDNISLRPSSPNTLDVGQRVNFELRYNTNERGGVRIFGRPFRDNQLAPGSAAHGAQLLPTGSGRSSGNFTLRQAGRVDRVRFQVMDAEQNCILLERFVPVDYRFVEE